MIEAMPRKASKKKGKAEPKRNNPTKLNAKQLKFVQNKVQGMNNTDAAREAGYSSPSRYAYELLEKPHILQLIEEGRRRVTEQTEMSALDVVRGWEQLAKPIDKREVFEVAEAEVFHPLTGVPMKVNRVLVKPSEKWPLNVAYNVSEVAQTSDGAIKVKFHDDRLGALNSLGKYHGILFDKKKHEHSGPGGGPIQTENTTPDLSSLSDKQLVQLREIRETLDAGSGTKPKGD